MLGFLDSSEREVISQVKEEASALAESVGESDDVPQTSSGIQQTKGEHNLMKASRRCSSGEHRRSTFNYYTFLKARVESTDIME